MIEIYSVRVLVKPGPHVPGLRARKGANTHWKSGLSSTSLKTPPPVCSIYVLRRHV